MVKFILLEVFCVLLVANTGSCQVRLTINQFNAFVDRIAVNLKQIRDAIPTPNNLITFRYQGIYETPNVRPLFESLPQSIKDLLTPRSPTTPAPTSSSISPITTVATKFEGSIRKTLDNETISAGHKSKFHVRLSASDQDKIIEVLNDFTTLANNYGIGVGLYKFGLQSFERSLGGSFPSNIIQRFTASLLASPIQVAKSFIIAANNEAIAKAQGFQAVMQDTQIMDTIIVLLQAVGELPELLILSLVG